MNRLDFRLPGGVKRDPEVEAWFKERPRELGSIARDWFKVMRGCGPDVRELVHDDAPVACVGDAPFAYVNAFSAHVNVGFFHGATLPDRSGLLEGSGKFMRHVKVKPGKPIDADAIHQLIEDAYAGLKEQLSAAS